jgi:transposase
MEISTLIADPAALRLDCIRPFQSAITLVVRTTLAQEFTRIVRERSSNKFNEWLRAATQSKLKEFESFARGLSEDYGAVKNALRYEWSNGQLEGQVNRLKTIKRQMYGRAKFDLLKARVLHTI